MQECSECTFSGFQKHAKHTSKSYFCSLGKQLENAKGMLVDVTQSYWHCLFRNRKSTLCVRHTHTPIYPH